MSKNLTPRYIVIGLVLAWALMTLWPSVKYQMLSPSDIEEMREMGTLESLENDIIKQGLDLKGGIYIVLEVDLPTLVSTLAINKDSKFEKTLSDVRKSLAENTQQDFSLYLLIAFQLMDFDYHGIMMWTMVQNRMISLPV